MRDKLEEEHMPMFQQINFLNQMFIENFEKEWLRLLDLQKDKLVSQIRKRVEKLMDDEEDLEESEAVKIAIDHRKHKILDKVDWNDCFGGMNTNRKMSELKDVNSNVIERTSHLTATISQSELHIRGAQLYNRDAQLHI